MRPRLFLRCCALALTAASALACGEAFVEGGAASGHGGAATTTVATVTGTGAGGGAGGSTAAAGGATSSGTATGGSGGMPAPSGPLVDRALLVRYWIDEAPNGTAIAQLQDSAPQPLPLPISYEGNLAFTKDSGHRALEFAQPGGGGVVAAAVDATKLAALNGATRATIEVVVHLSGATSLGTRILHFGDDFASYFSLEANATNELKLDWNNVDGNGIGKWSVDLAPLGRVVLHAVLDTEQAVAGQRVRLYIDCAPQTGALNPPALNEATSLPAGLHLALGNRPDGTRSMQGLLFYAAVYLDALTDAERTQNVTELLAKDDLP